MRAPARATRRWRSLPAASRLSASPRVCASTPAKSASCASALPGFPTAPIATAAEKALEGKTSSPNDIQAAAALVAQGVDANSDLHASADYRRHLAVVHAARALKTALSRIA